MKKTRKVVVCLFLLLVCGLQPGACPPPQPLPLRELAAESDYIVKAQLGEVSFVEVTAQAIPRFLIFAGDSPERGRAF